MQAGLGTQTDPGAGPSPASTTPQASSVVGAVSNYFTNWFGRVAAAQASQPHWITPLVTVTPRLEEEVRYDQF